MLDSVWGQRAAEAYPNHRQANEGVHPRQSMVGPLSLSILNLQNILNPFWGNGGCWGSQTPTQPQTHSDSHLSMFFIFAVNWYKGHSLSSG